VHIHAASIETSVEVVVAHLTELLGVTEEEEFARVELETSRS